MLDTTQRVSRGRICGSRSRRTPAVCAPVPR